MSRDFPDWIDVDRAAQARRVFAGRLRLAAMPRLVDLVDRPGAGDEIGFELALRRDEQGVARIEVHVAGQVPMTCQRTLRRYWQEIDSRSSLALIEDEALVDGLPEDLEAKLVPDGRLRLADVVEDELVLALPLVPRDPQSEPIEDPAEAVVESGNRPSEETAQDNPFAVLEKLKSH